MVPNVSFKGNFAQLQFFVGDHVLFLKFTESSALMFQINTF